MSSEGGSDFEEIQKKNATVRVPGFWRQCAIFCFLKSSAPLWLRNRVQGGDFRKVLSRMQLI